MSWWKHAFVAASVVCVACSGGGGDDGAEPAGDGGEAADAAPGADARPENLGTCPTGMVRVSGQTCIDATEATIDEFLTFLNGLGAACTDPGPTCTACGGKECFPSLAVNPWHWDEQDGWWIEGQVGMSLSHPARFVTFAAARTACQKEGKRLCSPDEWEQACSGEAQRRFLYGETYEPGRCNTANGFFGSPWEVGFKPECASPDQPSLVDMSGNVWEWVNDCSGGDCRYRGGSFLVDGSFFEDALSCAGAQGRESDDTDFDIGYRCCATPKL